MTTTSQVKRQGSTVLRQELQARRKAPKIVGGRKAGKYIPGRRAGKNHARTQGPLRGERAAWTTNAEGCTLGKTILRHYTPGAFFGTDSIIYIPVT